MLRLTLLSGIKLSMLLGNIAWIAMEYRHFHYSNVDIYKTLKTGKTHSAIENIQSLLGKLDMYNKCININKTRTKSYTKEFVYLFGGLSEDAIYQFQNIDDINTCLQNPYAVLEAVEMAAWSGMNISFDYTEANYTELNITTAYTTVEPADELINNASQIMPLFQDLGITVIQDLHASLHQQYQYGANLIRYEFIKTADFKKGIHYLENLADPTNPDLAKKLLLAEDFKTYQEATESQKHQLQLTNTIPTVNIKPARTSYYDKASVLAGTVYELFWKKPSHTHLLDMINRVRDTITEYSRNMRNQYNLYNDLFYDTRKELERISAKSTVAWKRASWLVVNTGVLGLQIIEYAIDDVGPFVLQYTEPVAKLI